MTFPSLLGKTACLACPMSKTASELIVMSEKNRSASGPFTENFMSGDQSPT